MDAGGKNKRRRFYFRFFIVIALCLIFGWYEQYSFNNSDHLYTIGTTKEIRTPLNGGPTVEYVYSINSKSYRHRAVIGYNSVGIEEEYVVKVLKSDHSESRLQFDMKVVDSVAVPEQGWKKIPKEILHKD